MNRKAKFAYFFMLIGLFVFMVSFLIILNHFLNGDFTKSSHLILKDKNFTHYINTNNPDSNLYLKLYCSFKDFITDNQVDQDTAHLNIIQSKCFTFFFSILLCSSDKVYFVIIILVCVFGFCLLSHGCINFYKYDISLLAMAHSSSNMSDVGTEQKMKKSDSDMCCIKSGILASPHLVSERVCPFAYEELPRFMVTNDQVGSRLGSYRSTDSKGTPNSPFLLDNKNSCGAHNFYDFNRTESKFKYGNSRLERPYRYRGLSSGSSSKFLGCDEIFL